MTSTTHQADAIRTRGLTKTYDAVTAVDHLDLVVRTGEVYGFLGSNGAGKTTTMRMLLGLIAPTSGEISVLGEAPGSRAGLAQVGSMIETPAFYPHLSGRDNLKVLAAYGGVDRRRIDEVLDTVDLAGRAGDAFRTYSLGMKQRLGVAAALLKDPPLLILDEPTNGLDPAGMADMRRLIRRLGSGDRTVLLSSHLMTEIEQTCDRIGIIAHGALVAEGTLRELCGDDVLVVRTDQVAKAHLIAASVAGNADMRDGEVHIPLAADRHGLSAEVNAQLVSAGIAVYELRRERPTLESVFLSITGQEAGEDEPEPAPVVALHTKEVSRVA